MPDSDIARATEGLFSTQDLEALSMEGAARQEDAYIQQGVDLTDKLVGFSQGSNDSVVKIEELIDDIIVNIEDYITIVANKSKSDVPSWLSPYCQAQYGYAPTQVTDITKTGPFSSGDAIGLGFVANIGLNQGGQFPSTSILTGVGQEGSDTLSLMTWKATVPTSISSNAEEIHKETYSSSAGAWAIHYPWNGIVSEISESGGSITEIKTTSALSNDPLLRYGRIDEGGTSKFDEFVGAGWGKALGDGWGKNLVGLNSFGSATIESHYIDNILTNTALLLVDRTTGVTASVAVSAASINQSDGRAITFDVAFDSNALFGRDISSFNKGEIAYACINASGSGGKHDQTYGFTAFLSWNCFEKDSTDNWRYFEDHGVAGPLRDTGYEGSALFINSQSIHNEVEARDLFYHVNINDETLAERDLFTVNQLQGVYSGMVKDLSSPNAGWTNQWAAISQSIEISKEQSRAYKNNESFNASISPVKPTERYLALLRSSVAGIQIKVPVDTLYDGDIDNGIKITLVTGAMYKADG
jgi:hypothetical protein